MIHIATATNPAYMPWAATLLLSALDRHPPGTLTFHVLHDGLGDRDTDRARQMVMNGGGEIEFHHVIDDRVSALRPSRSGGHVTWFRLLVPDLLPDLERVLLLDADTLVVDALDDLWTTDLDGALIAAVPNVVEPIMRDHVRGLGIDAVDGYLNAGVLLMDLGSMRAEHVARALVDFAMKNADRISWLDQDTLNVVLAGKWQHAHPRWNAMNSLWDWADLANEVFGCDTVREAIDAPAILHFEGPAICKPWHYLSTHQWRDFYRETLSHTPWADTPLDEATLVNHLISRLPKDRKISAYWRWVTFTRRMRTRLHRARARLPI